jgi:aspartate kinase
MPFYPKKFKVEFDENVTLYTIRHFNENAQTVRKQSCFIETSESKPVVNKEV